MFTKTKFLKKFRERRDDGFTIVEAAITIPMLALMGGTMFFFMAQSLLIMQENNAAAAAGSQVKELADEIRNIKDCEQLNEIVYDKSDKTIDNKGLYKNNNDSVKPYYIEVEYYLPEYLACPKSNTQPELALNDSMNLLTIKAKLGSIPESEINEEDKVLFETVSVTNIQGVL